MEEEEKEEEIGDVDCCSLPWTHFHLLLVSGLYEERPSCRGMKEEEEEEVGDVEIVVVILGPTSSTLF